MNNGRTAYFHLIQLGANNGKKAREYLDTQNETSVNSN